MSQPFTTPLESIATCFEGIIPCVIATVAGDGTPNVTYLSIVYRVDETHVALSRQFFNKTDKNTISNPLAQVVVIEPETGRSFRLDLKYERTEGEGPLFEFMKNRLDAVSAHEGMTNVFRLKGVDVCEVLACEPIPCDFPAGPPPRNTSIEKVEAFSQRVAEIDDLDELLLTTILASQQMVDCRHAFVMLVDESGERLHTVASVGYRSSGTGSEVRVGEGIIGLAAARRQSVRVTHLGRDLAYSQASRETREHFEGGVPLPRLPSVQSQMVTPMLAARNLVGVICLQSDKPGAFQADDECVAGIVANQAAMAITGLRSARGDSTGA